jgi:hypothetical protein
MSPGSIALRRIRILPPMADAVSAVLMRNVRNGWIADIREMPNTAPTHRTKNIAAPLEATITSHAAMDLRKAFVGTVRQYRLAANARAMLNRALATWMAETLSVNG